MSRQRGAGIQQTTSRHQPSCFGSQQSHLQHQSDTRAELPKALTAMDNRIGLELRGKKKAEVTQLDLSGCNTGGEIVGLTEEFSALETLDLQNASLTNIKLFPKLANLTKLDLSGNRLSKGLEVLKDCPSLKSLSLSNNKLKEIQLLTLYCKADKNYHCY